MANKNKSEAGFTLIELLIVVVIMGILAGVVSLGVANAREQSVKEACRTSVTVVVDAIYMYQLDSGAAFSAVPTAPATTLVAPTTNFNVLVPKYLRSLPAVVRTSSEPYFVRVTRNADGSYLASGHFTNTLNDPQISGCSSN